MDSFDIKGIKLSNCLVLRIDDILYKSYKCLFDKIKSKSKIHSYLFENLDINLFESIVHLYDLYNISSILKTRQLDSFIPFISNESIKQNIINYINIYKHIPDFIIDINNMLSDFFPIFCLMDSFDIKGIKLSNCLVLRIDDILYKSYKCTMDSKRFISKFSKRYECIFDLDLILSNKHLYDLYNISSILKTRQLDSFIPFISNESIKQNIINYINIYKHIPDCFIVCFKSEIKDFIIDINNMLSDFFPIFCLLGEKKIQFYYYIYILMNHLGVENIEDNTCVPRNKLANIPEIFILSLRKNLCINHSSMRLKEIILTINVVLSTIGFRLSTSTDPSIKSKRKRKVIDGETVDITNYNIIANYNSLYNCII